MKKRVYFSLLFMAVLIAAGVAMVMTTGKSDLALAREASERYQRMDLVLADGFTPLFECTSDPSAGAMGMHYIQPDRFDAELDPTEPEALVFEPQADGRIELVAVEYIIPAAAWSGSEPPSFLGQTLQYKTAVGPHEVDPYYELHAWVWADNPSGVFADWNPEVTCLASALAGSSAPEYSAGDLPPSRIVSRSDVYDSPDGGGTFGVDDAYDLAAAAAGLPFVLFSPDSAAASLSGDDAYDPAAGGLPVFPSARGVAIRSTYSGDDAYDPAAGGIAFLLSAGGLADTSLSGDDAYDPAAGGLGGAGGIDLIFSAGSEFGACSTSASVVWGYC